MEAGNGRSPGDQEVPEIYRASHPPCSFPQTGTLLAPYPSIPHSPVLLSSDWYGFSPFPLIPTSPVLFSSDWYAFIPLSQLPPCSFPQTGTLFSPLSQHPLYSFPQTGTLLAPSPNIPRTPFLRLVRFQPLIPTSPVLLSSDWYAFSPFLLIPTSPVLTAPFLRLLRFICSKLPSWSIAPP